MKGYRIIFDLLYKNQPKTKISYNPEQFVKNFYHLINNFYCALLRNELYSDIFGLLQVWNQIGFTPSKLMDFVNSYVMFNGMLAYTSKEEFITRAKKHFGVTEKNIQKLVFSDTSNDSFPLFVDIQGTVNISHRTAFIIYVLMHAISYKDFFDKETQKQSKEFESIKTKKAFEILGWNYFSNMTDKKNQSIEIDGIVTSNRKMLVVECKGWTLRPFYEYNKIIGYLIRDIKGIVDGLKFSHGKSNKIPSLSEKVRFVKSNMAIWNFDPKDFDEVKGVIVMRGHPPISDYKGFRITSIRDIPKYFN